MIQMRWIIFSFFLSSLGLFGAKPSEVALEFLQKVQTSGEAEGLGISDFCGPVKKKMIEERWQSRAAWLEAGEFRLGSLGEKIDGDLAAVLIGARSQENPDSASVIALGLVKKGDDWKVAPLEGRFENTGLGFEEAVKIRARGLEKWMSLGKVTGRDQILKEERERFRKTMEGVVDAEKLKLEDPEDVLNEFLAAAHAGETEKLLVWQGILERDELPERDWERDIEATRLGMKSSNSKSAWRTMRSNKVMKVIVEGQGDTEDADYLVAFLSSFRTNPRNESLNAVRFKLNMTKYGWRIQLPTYFGYDHESQRVHRDAFNERFYENRRSANEMGYVFEAENDTIRTDDPKAMLDGVVEDLKTGALHTFLQRHYREMEKFDDEEEEGEEEENQANQIPVDGDIDERRMERYRAEVRWWGGALGHQETTRLSIQKLYQDGDLALGVFELNTSKDSSKPEYRELWMAKDEEGWMILPGDGEPLENSLLPSLIETRNKLSLAYSKDLLLFEKEYLAGLLKGFEIMDLTGSAIDEEGALKLVKEWQDVAARGSTRDLAGMSAARVIPEDTETFIKDFTYLRLSAGKSEVPARALGSKASGPFRAVSLMMDMGSNVAPVFPLAIVVPTKDGHRVLADIELPLETNKGIRLLNDGRIKALVKELPEKDLAAIKTLREWHQKLARPVWEKWSRDQAAKLK
ncbi:hypothetical protein N9891_01145 [bacterium]|nr:hypothetical protein [bacterium]